MIRPLSLLRGAVIAFITSAILLYALVFLS